VILLVSVALVVIAGSQASNSPPPSDSPQAAANAQSLTAAEVSDLQLKAEKGDVTAEFKLGRAYLQGDGVPRNEVTAAKWFRKAADQGEPAAENQLGNVYRSGIGVPQEKEEAVRWYQKAARQGNAAAMFNLATCYYNGDGVGSSEYIAYSWFLLAQDAGHPAAEDAVKRSASTMSKADSAEAFLRISEMYSKGGELPNEDAQSLRWLRRAAEISSRAKVILAIRILAGPQPDQHYGEVMQLCRDAASNDANGARCAGFLYRRGLGVQKDPAEAIGWYKKAAAWRNGLAAMDLAEMYATGEGTAVDRPEAFVMFVEADKLAVKGALQKARIVYQQMDKAEIKKTNGKLKERRLDPKQVLASLQQVPAS
jgi:uncharacterized protein